LKPGTELLQQRTEVELIYSDTIHLKYPAAWAKELTKNLEKCLENWMKIVEISKNDR
jgi:hypothetical protein